MNKNSKNSKNSKISKNCKSSSKFKNNKSSKFRKSNEKEGPQETVGRENDISWYNKYPQLVQDSAKINFFTPLGNKFSLIDQESTKFSRWLPTEEVMPGIWNMHFVPSIGVSNDFGSQINVTARNIYTFIRSANSGHANYEANDLMMYVLAMDSIYSFYAWMLRVYGSAGMYSPVNKYLPEALFTAYGVDFQDVQNNLAKFRMYINMFGAKMGSLVVPAQTPYATRHQWLNLNMFYDASTSKGQIYLFTQEVFHRYNDQYNDQGTGLVAERLRKTTNKLTVDQIIAFGDALMKGIMSSEDAYIISGDILKAFGTNGIFKLGMIDEAFSVSPILSGEVLTQIQNATLVPGINYSTLDITSNANSSLIVSNPSVHGAGMGTESESKMVLNPYHENLLNRKQVSLPMDNPTPEQIMIATRLTASGSITQIDPPAIPGSGSPGTYDILLDATGTEIIVDVDIITIDLSTSELVAYSISNFNIQTRSASASSLPLSTPTALAAISAFDYHPAIFVPIITGSINSDLSTSSTTSVTFYKDFVVQNYAYVSRYELQNMHEVALLSELTWDTVTRATGNNK